MKGKRSKRGVLVCAVKSNHDLIRITLDDVVRKNDDVSWDMDCFITSKDYDKKSFDEMNFDEKDLASFGYHIFCRLHAFKKCGDL